MIEITNILEVEKYLDAIDVVIFDMDDTLYSEKDYVKSGYKKIANNFLDIKNMYEKLWEAFINKKPAIDFVLESEGKLDYKSECISIYREQIPDIDLYPGVLDMLKRISQKKKLGLITDGRPEGQKAKLQSLGIENVFDKIIITDELGGPEFRKPNPKAFIIMHNYFKCDYNKMVYIGDNLKKDFVAPLKLGMKAIHFINDDGLYK